MLTGDDIVVELAHPTSPDTRLARDLAANGELPHAMTFKVLDLEAAERHIESTGVRIVDRVANSFTLDPDDMLNAVYTFTNDGLPGDPGA